MITRMELGKEQPGVERIPYHTTEAMSRFAPSVAASGEFGSECVRLCLVASSAAKGEFLAMREQKTVIAGQLLQEIKRLPRLPLVQRCLDQFHRLIGEYAPEAGRSSALALGAPPEKPDSGRVFRAEEFDSPLTDDSDKRL